MTQTHTNYSNSTLTELVEILIVKTMELLEYHHNPDGGKFQNLLLEVEEIQQEIKRKKQESCN